MLVVRGNGLPILLAPPRTASARKLFSQRALERSRQIDPGVTRGVEQIASDAYIGRALRHGFIAQGCREFPFHMRILAANLMRINYAHR